MDNFQLNILKIDSGMYRILINDDPATANEEFVKLYFYRYDIEDLIWFVSILSSPLKKYDHTYEYLQKYIDHIDYLDMRIDWHHQDSIMRCFINYQLLDKVYNHTCVRKLIYWICEVGGYTITDKCLNYILKYVDDIPLFNIGSKCYIKYSTLDGMKNCLFCSTAYGFSAMRFDDINPHILERLRIGTIIN